MLTYSLLYYQDVNESIKQVTVEGKQQLEGHINDVTSSSKQAQTNFGSGDDGFYSYSTWDCQILIKYPLTFLLSLYGLL